MGILRRLFSPAQPSTAPLTLSGSSILFSSVSAAPNGAGRRLVRRLLDVLGISSSYDIIRILAASLLVVAAAATTHQLATQPIMATSVWKSRPFLIVTVLANLAVGAWLLCGLAPHPTRIGASIWFAMLAGVSITNAWHGSETCGCFGAARIPPGPVALDDASIVLAFWLCCDRVSIRPPRGFTLRFVIFLAAAGAGGALASAAMATYSSAAQHVFDFPPHIYSDDDYVPAAYSLSVVNSRKTPVRFCDLRSSCGCTKAHLRKEELAPGEEGTLDLEINQRGIVGMRTVFIALVDDVGTFWEYTVNAPAYPVIRLEPADLYLGELLPGGRGERSITLYTFAMGRDPLVPRVGQIDSANVSVDVGESRLEALDDSVMRRATDFRVTVKAPVAVERQIGHISLIQPLQGGGDAPAATLRVHWFVQSAFRLSSERLFFGDQRGSSADRMRRDITIERENGAAFQVTAATSADEAVECEASHDETKRVWTLRVLVDLSKVHGPLSTRISITTDCRETPLISLPLSIIR
jgi:hypothetical protein